MEPTAFTDHFLYGRKIGFPTPYNDKVVEIIHKIEEGELKASFDNVKLF